MISGSSTPQKIYKMYNFFFDRKVIHPFFNFFEATLSFSEPLT